MDQTVTDPTGFEVTITDACWGWHVVIRHPEMAPFLEAVKETIAVPEEIWIGRRNSDARIYRRRYEAVAGIGNFLDLLVFVGNSDRFMDTAYFRTASIRGLGERIWPSS